MCTHQRIDVPAQVSELRSAVERERAALEQLEEMIESERRLLSFSASSRSASQSPVCPWRNLDASTQSVPQAVAHRESLVATLFVEESEEILEKKRRAAEKRAAFLAAAATAPAIMTPGQILNAHDEEKRFITDAGQRERLHLQARTSLSGAVSRHSRGASRSPSSSLADGSDAIPPDYQMDVSTASDDSGGGGVFAWLEGRRNEVESDVLPSGPSCKII